MSEIIKEKIITKGNFNFIETKIKNLYIIEPKIFGDNRGYFMESYNRRNFIEAGLDMVFVQDNESKSKKGVLRGMHFQTKFTQGKLVRATQGEVYDVAVLKFLIYILLNQKYLVIIAVILWKATVKRTLLKPV